MKNKMSIGKKEIILISILGILLYGFVFYKFIWVPVLPDITDKNNQIAQAQKQKDELDKDLQNIEFKKMDLGAKNTNNERLEEFIMNNANLTDSIEYADKLVKMFGQSINSISVEKPVENSTQSGKKYYEMKLSVGANLKYLDAEDVIRYLEGGTRKVKVTNFKMLPIDQNKNGANNKKTAQPSPKPEDQLFNTSMVVSLYTLDISSADKMYEYGRHRFTKFINNDGILFVPTSVTNPTSITNPQVITQNIQTTTPDILILEYGFLTAGDNLEVYMLDKPDDTIRIKTKKARNMVITLSGTSYTVETLDSSDKPQSVKGNLPAGDLNIGVKASIPAIKDNADMQLNVKIVNNANKKVVINVEDSSKRVKVSDRNGNSVINNSAREKMNISWS